MSEKPHAPTHRKLEQSRARGDVALSAILVQSAGLCAALVVLPGTLAALVQHFRSRLMHALTSGSIEGSARGLVGDVLGLALPVLIVVSAASLASGLLQTRGTFAPRRADSGASPHRSNRPAWSSSFGASSPPAFTLLARILIVAAGIWLLRDHAGSFGNAVGHTRAALSLAGVVALRLAWLVAFITAAVGLAHYALARRARWQRLRMSEAELRREQRENHGDPVLRTARRRRHLELLEPARHSPSQPEPH